MFDSIIYAVRRLLQPTDEYEYIEDTPSIEHSNDPLSREGSGFDTKEIEVTIHSTEELTYSNGRIPEQMIALYLNRALNRAEYNHTIRYNFDTVDVSTQQSVCGEDSVYGEWRDLVNSSDIKTATNSNILVTNASGGGCAGVGGKVAAVPGGDITRMRPHSWQSSEDWASNIHAALHEFGHNMMISHDMDPVETGNQHAGMAWNENGYWHRTPTVAGNSADNICGEYIEKRRNDDVMHHQYFSECAIQHFEY